MPLSTENLKSQTETQTETQNCSLLFVRPHRSGVFAKQNEKSITRLIINCAREIWFDPLTRLESTRLESIVGVHFSFVRIISMPLPLER